MNSLCNKQAFNFWASVTMFISKDRHTPQQDHNKFWFPVTLVMGFPEKFCNYLPCLTFQERCVPGSPPYSIQKWCKVVHPKPRGGNHSQVPLVGTQLVQLLMEPFHLLEKKVHVFMTIQLSLCCVYLSVSLLSQRQTARVTTYRLVVWAWEINTAFSTNTGI